MSTAAPSPEPIAADQAPLPTLEELPDDTATLKRMIVELVVALRQRDHNLQALQHRLHLLLQRLYGPRTEHFDPSQLLLFAAGAEQAAEQATGESTAAEAQPTDPKRKRPSKPHGRRLLPDNLPRRPLHHELSEAERVCVCGQVRIDIGTDDGGEQLDWQPASYFVWQHFIHKYLCPNCAAQGVQAQGLSARSSAADKPCPDEPAVAMTANEAPATAAPSAQTESAQTELAAGQSDAAREVSPSATPIGPAIIAAPKPPMPIAKGLPGPGLLAHIIVSKYFDHLPLYRQEHISQRHGVLIPRSTSCDWMAACAQLLRPLHDLMVTAVLQSSALHTDDTEVKNLGHEPGLTDKGRFWIYWGDRSHPYNVFDFTINRKRDGPQTFLADFHGYLQADAFSGYNALYLPDARAGTTAILEVACNAHARRKFHEAKGSHGLLACQALAYYGQLYDLERAATANGFDEDQRLRMRRDLAVPILDKFRAWLDTQRAQVLPKSPIAEAIGYALNNWTALCRYTEAGFLAIDNNVAEREMKRIAIGRKNWLFVGSQKGGKTAAVLFSFTSTCHRLGIEPWAYLQDMLTRLPALPADQLVDLLPDRWQAARSPVVPHAAKTPATDSVP